MTKKINEKTDGITFTLSNGCKAVMRKANGADIIKARKNAQDEETVFIYLAALLTEFDGKKLPAEELFELDADDFLLIEMKVRDLIQTKNFLRQGIS